MSLIVRETFRAFRRAPLLSALSITTIAFSLFVFGLFGLVAVNIRRAIGSVAERVEVVAYLKRGTPPEAITVAQADITAFPEVESVDYVTEERALQRARHDLPEFQDIFQDLEANPLPASLDLRLKPPFRDAAHVADVARRVRSFEFVDDVRYGLDWVAKLDRLRDIAGAVGSVLALGSMISTQAMPGATVVFLYLAVVWFVLYAACGALSYLAAGAQKRMVAAAFWGFGIGGAAAGELVAILVMSDNLASHARVLGAFAIPATIPWLLGFFMTRWLAAGWA